jgi:Uma2 family endonuclease
MPYLKKAELIEGVVYMSSPVSHERHGKPTARILWWLGHYLARTAGVDVGDNSTVMLDLDNEPQPDAFLRVLPRCGGRTRPVAGGYIEGSPELVCEVSASSVSYDLHDKKDAYRRNGVREYVVWRVDDDAIDWFVLRGGTYETLAADADGIFRSANFPGLWLDGDAMRRDELTAVLAVLEAGLAAPAHAAYVARLVGDGAEPGMAPADGL